MTGETGKTRRQGARSKRGRAIALACAIGVGASTGGCYNTDNFSREDKLAIGAVAGAVLGGFIGYHTLGSGTGQWLAALAVGAAGAYGGRYLADRLTTWDKAAMQETAFETLTSAPSGATATWKNQETGTNGTITPVRTFLDHSGRICREYEATLSLDGESHDGREIACRTVTGDWIINQTTG